MESDGSIIWSFIFIIVEAAIILLFLALNVRLMRQNDSLSNELTEVRQELDVTKKAAGIIERTYCEIMDRMRKNEEYGRGQWLKHG